MSGPLSRASDAALLLARLLLSLIFVHEGATLLVHFQEATASVAPMGVSPSLLGATIALQLVAGIAIALGWLITTTRSAA